MVDRDLRWDEWLNIEIGVLLATLQDATREWRENLERPVKEAIVWSPYENGPSIGGLLLHMASCEQYWLGKVAAGIELPENDPSWAYDSTMDQYVPFWPKPPAEPIGWYFQIQDEVRGRMADLISGHNQPDTVHERNTTQTYRWILARVVEHDSYHGGQAVLLHEMYKKLAS